MLSAYSQRDLVERAAEAGVSGYVIKPFDESNPVSYTHLDVYKRQDPAFLSRYDLSSLRALFLAGEPLDEPTAQWISTGLNKPVIDNYWQTETGWPILGLCNGIEKADTKFGSPGKAVYGLSLIHI